MSEPGHMEQESSGMLLHYQLLHKLGAGGMGEVFLALDTRLDRKVAIKTLSGSGAMTPEMRRRLHREARTAAQLSHPNICGIYSIEDVGDATYIIMEYVEGITLGALRRLRLPSYELVIRVATQCCEGLAAAHESGVIHRDITAANIMICGDDRVKIMDFGLAKQMAQADLTQTMGMMGTYPYMSPEQVTGQSLDVRSDLFSLGSVLYEFICGQLPFGGEHVAAIAYALAHEQPRPLSFYRPDIPLVLEQTIMHALTKDRQHRYQTAREMMADLKAVYTVSNPISTRHDRVQVHAASIAVFPFRILGKEPDADYIADGLCEDILIRLSKIRNLRVASNSAVSRLRDKTSDLGAISRTLGVAVYLEGSIRRNGAHLRINSQLVRADDGFTIWSEQFDRQISDILDLQAELAEQISSALFLSLSEDEQKTVERVRVVAFEAYDLYLRGRFHLKRRDARSTAKAVELFNIALTIAPNFVSALAQLSLAYGLQLLYGFDRTAGLAHKAYDLASKAVAQDASSPEAQMALGMSLRYTDLQNSVLALRRAIEHDQKNVEGHHYLAHACVLIGRYDEAAEHELAALAADPFHTISRAQLCRVYFWMGNSDALQKQLSILREDALSSHLIHATEGWLAWCRRDWHSAFTHCSLARQADPNNAYVADYLVDSLRRLNRLDEAKAVVTDTGVRHPDRFESPARLGQIQMMQGRLDEAAALFAASRTLLERETEEWLNPHSAVYCYNNALIQTLAGAYNEALASLDQAAAQGFGHYADLETRPDWDGLRSFPRFAELIKSLKANQQSQ